ncbi:hypothetical protein D4T97_010895 [Siminovitchia acidinfaciens]|uniref:Uncharacterized protein n=1 Tax=Siminovitchia acidinfaciens TaxID=2321395 RepID=A0A429XZN2_9BACI|nr:hypothetical protein [Siminovitchia acidinfaciens]RST74179.1 hypothetical protein D4T97_010895 [Siminovitchia acidinfaciens]
MSKKKIFILLLIALVLLFFWNNPMKKEQEHEWITQSLYDEWYERQPTWSIKEFPKQGKQFNGHQYAWSWSYVANSLIDMYKATGDEKYLDQLVPQVEYIFTQTDQKLGIESYTNSGLYLPAWSDGGHFTSGKFNYIYPVHTGMIILPILRFVDTVKENHITKYMETADRFLLESGKALAIHNQQKMWIDFSANEGFYMGHSYGNGIVSEADKIGIPNRIFAYLAACGLYDKLTGENIYTEQIEKSLRYFKQSLVKYDEEFDSYYWSYWDYSNAENWEDISHAALTVYGIFILHEEAGFKVFKKKDFEKFKNIVFKIVSEDAPTKVRKFIHPLKNEQKSYYTPKESKYYFFALRWSFLGLYDEKVLERLDDVYEGLYYQNKVNSTGLFSIALYLSVKEKLKD